MKLLISTFSTQLLEFTGSSYGQDFDEIKLFAEKGNANAQFLLGIYYFNGDGVPENDAEAVKWFRLAAEQGDVDAQYNLGIMYNNGQGVPENKAEAVNWYRLAAEQGNAPAQYFLGSMYYNGDGVPQNNIRAYVWWSVAATQGHEDARGNRDIVSERLTPTLLGQAQQIATKCFESGYKDCD